MTEQVNNTPNASNAAPAPQEQSMPLSASTTSLLHMLQCIFTEVSVKEKDGQTQMDKEMEQAGLKQAQRSFWREMDSAIGGALTGIGSVAGGAAAIGMVGASSSLDSQIDELKGNIDTINEYQDALESRTPDEEIFESRNSDEADRFKTRIDALQNSDTDASDLDLDKARIDDLNDRDVISSLQGDEPTEIKENLENLKTKKQNELDALKAKKGQHVGLKAQAVNDASRGAANIVKTIPDAFSASSGKNEQLFRQSYQAEERVEQNLGQASGNDAATAQKLQEVNSQVVNSQTRTV